MKCTDCNREVKPVISLDIDGTLGRYHDHFHTFAENYLGRSLRSGFTGICELHEWYGLELHEYRAIKLAYRQGGLKRSMPMYEEAVGLSAYLRDDLGCELWISTTRPYLRLDNIDPDTREWLDRNSIKYDGLIYGEDKYRQLAEIVGSDRIIGILDDLPSQVKDAQAVGLPAYIVPRYHNRSARHGELEYSAAPILNFKALMADRKEEWDAAARI